MKYSPRRMCAVCRKSKNKQDLIRIVEQNSEFVIDEKQKINTRGFYICKAQECINNITKKRVLSRLKKTNIANEKHENLQNFLNKFVYME